MWTIVVVKRERFGWAGGEGRVVDGRERVGELVAAGH